MSTPVLSKTLQRETVSLLREHPPYHIYCTLRNIYFDHLYYLGHDMIPADFRDELFLMDSLFKWLETAVKETGEWGVGSR